MAATAKINAGAARGSTSSGSTTPPRRAPSSSAAPIVPSRDRMAVPGSRPSSKVGNAAAGRRSISAMGAAARQSGRPVTSQCDSAFTAASATGGWPESSI